MILHQAPRLDTPSDCPYLPGRIRRFRYFAAEGLTQAEIAHLLERGWRKFGPYFFRPDCIGCRECVPLRVPVPAFRPSKSQRRTCRRNADLTVRFGPLRFDKRILDIYTEHSLSRFAKEAGLEDLVRGFYMPSCPSLMSEFALDGRTIAVGFLDRGDNCLSSVYFVFDTAQARRGLGTFGVMEEIGHARTLGLRYYYLGYYIADCPRMAYKARFTPNERYHWESRSWRSAADSGQIHR